ncbi:response regulator [Flagellimonas hymeniacidonis]|uniref:Response regulator n=1 Tax=Flagellimonas hymeniacidonis TaxID=2603628 RepID=A0A5C8V7H6_9FLAO|nr:response regulator [Flagellimonas hymeniacidonis]TXN36748.1 response regulator [Flagellimonas hymeniacidonis]
MKYTTLVIDDSSIQRLATTVLVKNHPDLKLIGSYQNPYCGIKAVYDEKVDIVFLDVLMEHVDAFELLDNIEINAAIIMNSTWSDFAAKAFEYGIDDFLMKPMPKKRFNIAVDKIIKQIEQRKVVPPKVYLLSEVLSTFKEATIKK